MKRYQEWPTVFWMYASRGAFLTASSLYTDSMEFSIMVSLVLL